MSAEDLEAGGTSAATSMSTATASRSAPCPACTRRAAPTSRAAARATPTRATPRPARTTSTTWSGCCGSSTARRRWCRSRSSRTPARKANGAVIYYGSTVPAMDEALELLEQRGRAPGQHAHARLPVPATRSTTSSPSTSRSSSSNRTATRSCARCWSTSSDIDPARLVPILHYDGTPITARFIVQAIAARAKPSNVRPLKRGKAA